MFFPFAALGSLHVNEIAFANIIGKRTSRRAKAALRDVFARLNSAGALSFQQHTLTIIFVVCVLFFCAERMVRILRPVHPTS